MLNPIDSIQRLIAGSFGNHWNLPLEKFIGVVTSFDIQLVEMLEPDVIPTDSDAALGFNDVGVDLSTPVDSNQ